MAISSSPLSPFVNIIGGTGILVSPISVEAVRECCCMTDGIRRWGRDSVHSGSERRRWTRGWLVMRFSICVARSVGGR